MQMHPESHMDHGFTQAQWDYIFTKYADTSYFFIDTFELPEGLGTVTNELYGPTAGDSAVLEADVFYAKRGQRAWPSRMVRLPKRPTRFVRVIAGPHEEKCAKCNGTGLLFSLGTAIQFGNGSMTDGEYTCTACKGTEVTKYACILYTAYGVASIDMSAAPKEPGDLLAQYNALPVGDERRGKLREEVRVAEDFWALHALAT